MGRVIRTTDILIVASTALGTSGGRPIHAQNYTAPPAASAGVDTVGTYTDSSSGVRLSYPGNWNFRPGDHGIDAFVSSPDGDVHVQVADAEFDDSDDPLGHDFDRMVAVSKNVDYKRLNREQGWYVISGHDGDRGYYLKVLYAKPFGKGLSVEYSYARETEYEAAIALLSRSFANVATARPTTARTTETDTVSRSAALADVAEAATGSEILSAATSQPDTREQSANQNPPIRSDDSTGPWWLVGVLGLAGMQSARVVARRRARSHAASKTGISNSATLKTAPDHRAASGQTPAPGSVYLGKIESIRSETQSAWVGIGAARLGRLHISEIGGAPDGVDRPISATLSLGQELLVQVVEPADSADEIHLTAVIHLTGSYFAIAPHASYVRFSSDVADARERQRVDEVVCRIGGDRVGCTVLPSASGASATMLTEDLQSLMDRWKRARRKVRVMRAPALAIGAEEAGDPSLARGIHNGGASAEQPVSSSALDSQPDIPPPVERKPAGRDDSFSMGELFSLTKGVAILVFFCYAGWQLLSIGYRSFVGPEATLSSVVRFSDRSVVGTWSGCSSLSEGEAGACNTGIKEGLRWTDWERLDFKTDSTFDRYATAQTNPDWGTKILSGRWSSGRAQFMNTGEWYDYVRVQWVDPDGDHHAAKYPIVNGRMRLTNVDNRPLRDDDGDVVLTKGDHFPR